MKHIYIFLFLTFSFSTIGQNSIYPDIPYANLAFVDSEGDYIITGGSCDLGMYSTDGGQNWTYFNAEIDFKDIQMVPGSGGKKAYFLTKSEVLLFDTADESISPTGISTSSPGFTGNFRAMAIIGNDMYIVGDISVAKADITNLVWESIGEFVYESNDLIDYVDATDNFIYTGTRKGKVFKTDVNAGTTILQYEFENDIRGLTMGTDNIGYVKVNNDPSKTTDGGATWTAITSFPETSTLYAYGEDVIISMNTNRLVVSSDGGATAEYVEYRNNSVAGYNYGAKFDNNGKLTLVGSSSTILTSTDNGVTNQNLNPYNRAEFYAIDINENGTGLALGGNHHIVTTSDYGDTWTQVPYPADADNPYFTGAVVLNDGTMLATTDDGIFTIQNNSATQMNTQAIQNILYNPDGSILIGTVFQGGSYVVRKSTDQGQTWDLVTTLEEYGWAMHRADDGSMYIAGNEEFYYRSIDNGASFQKIDHNLGKNIQAFYFMNPNEGLVAVANQLLKTTDGGVTFEEIATGFAINNVYMFSSDHIVYSNAQNSLTNVKESLDGGESWSSPVSFCVRSFSSTSVGKKVFFGHDGGHINAFTISEDTNTAETKKQNIFSLQTNLISCGDNLIVHCEDNCPTEILIMDNMGRMIDKQMLNGNQTQLKTNILNEGLYFIIGKKDNSITTHKLVVLR